MYPESCVEHISITNHNNIQNNSITPHCCLYCVYVAHMLITFYCVYEMLSALENGQAGPHVTHCVDNTSFYICG